MLHRALTQVEDCESLSNDQRDKLTRNLNLTIQSFDPRNAVVRTTPPPLTRPVAPINDDNKKTYDTVKGIYDSRTQAKNEFRDVKTQKESAYLGVNREINKASIPEFVDYKLPADWAEKSKHRHKVTMTDRERAILRELNKTRTVDYDGQTLEEVINQLSKSMGQTITLNKADLESVGAS